MQILILGGGLFVGAAVLDAALARGHAVTVFNRGQTRSCWPANVEAIFGDRSAALSALQGRHWDAVIDTSGYAPADVRASTQALQACSRYLFVSSVSAYASFAHAPIREGDALCATAGIAQYRRDPAVYGAQKAACEAEVRQWFGDRATVVRPGLVVGPGDPTGRFSHWPWRAMAGGALLVPQVPTDADQLQMIDARDLAAFIVGLVERDLAGTFNATGPPAIEPLHWPVLIAACLDAASTRGAPPGTVHPVAEAVLLDAGVVPWSELPLWLPSSGLAWRGFMRIDTAAAVAAGLRTRPIASTIADIIDEGVPEPDHSRRGTSMSRAREAALLVAATGTSPHNGMPLAP